MSERRNTLHQKKAGSGQRRMNMENRKVQGIEKKVVRRRKSPLYDQEPDFAAVSLQGKKSGSKLMKGDHASAKPWGNAFAPKVRLRKIEEGGCAFQKSTLKVGKIEEPLRKGGDGLGSFRRVSLAWEKQNEEETDGLAAGKEGNNIARKKKNLDEPSLAGKGGRPRFFEG